MITDAKTDFVYFSGLIEEKYPDCWKRIKSILDKHKIDYKTLDGTRDIWCRDYMPVQTDVNRFVQFRYDAAYLHQEPEKHTRPFEVLQANQIEAELSDIILDGGNVIRGSDKVIMTNRIFKDNPDIEKNELIKRLEEQLQAEVLIIPAISSDETGHADGHVWFIDSKTLLVNELKYEYLYWQDGFRRMIRESGLKYVEMPWFDKKYKGEPLSAIGIYVNYLEVGNLILFPVFEIPGNKDQVALDVIKKVFPDKIIEPVEINEIGLKGGLMNCISWNIKKSKQS
ncbi:MAG: agmatine deiminase family protein [Bacteroidales bacterium]|nr:agmatine deiminase family protein [Bacteroidales bacterium]